MDKKNKLVEFYYEYIKESYFIDALHKFANKEGFGHEYVWCVFADYYEHWEEEYFGDSGVAFYFEPPAVSVEIDVILTNEEFYDSLVKRAEEYVLKNTDSTNIVNELLLTIKKNLNL